jgi:hypothetical protein
MGVFLCLALSQHWLPIKWAVLLLSGSQLAENASYGMGFAACLH